MSSIASPDDTDHATSSGVEKLDKIVAEKTLDCVKFCTANCAVRRNVAGDCNHLLAKRRRLLLCVKGLRRCHAAYMPQPWNSAECATGE